MSRACTSPVLPSEQWKRRILRLVDLVRAGRGDRVECREALIDGERVVVLGVKGRRFTPVAVVLDHALTERLKFGDHGPWSPRKPQTGGAPAGSAPGAPPGSEPGGER